MEAYSMDLRVRVMADVDRDMPTVTVAKKYSVSAGWIRKLKRFRRDTDIYNQSIPAGWSTADTG